MRFVLRPASEKIIFHLQTKGIHPLWAKLYAGRGIVDVVDMSTDMSQLLPPDRLLGIDKAVGLIDSGYFSAKVICIVGDYDCDGATATAVATLGLKKLGAPSVISIIPDRKLDGYGLTPAIVQKYLAKGAEVLVTVDNGIASIEGVNFAKLNQLQVIITDHHLPGAELPLADAIVNPNQPSCNFPSKNLAGVGVIFYVLIALRQHLKTHYNWSQENLPKLDFLLPLVAVGTVADMVKLDQNNRCLVHQGLKRIRQGNMPIGLKVLFASSKKDYRQTTTQDIGFSIAPRINATGRMANMGIGVECLSTNDMHQAQQCVMALEQANETRKQIETSMHQSVLEALQNTKLNNIPQYAISYFEPSFHPGIVGIIASRLKEKYNLPVFIFAPKQEEILVGSGRSINGIHLRDTLDLMSKRVPNLLMQFGGHAMATGCTIKKEDFSLFQELFAQIILEQSNIAVFDKTIYTDGPLDSQYCRPDIALALEQEVWGQGFETPVFQNDIKLLSQKLIVDKHIQATLEFDGKIFSGIWFNRVKPLPNLSTYAYKLLYNSWHQSVQLNLLATRQPS